MSTEDDQSSVSSEGETAASGRKWLRDEVSKQMNTSPTFGMLADLELLAEPFFLDIDNDKDPSS